MKHSVDHRVVRCPECGGARTWQIGMVPARAGRKMRYKCVSCARSFYYKRKKNKKAAVSIKPKAFEED